ncbi:putative damage-inducible protein DinB [Paenibacillus phyllosphaerae]|uniref:Putative damage-inducible protein DinB n=1 Tax=Paenibacillus phyllosphaerae TaxID=274593 RepID=A0A7W5B521_9BACL|nr:DinB family protein [Paenibacillus phyllosphaerae]MBB3113811.1 putative damage-inducible protein DinB [Paenibacillus phyllosphaerae]
MSEGGKVIGEFQTMAQWAERLYALGEKAWCAPIAEGKASIAEIMAHLLCWDQHLIDRAVPAVTRGEGIEFPAFDPFNADAYAYARSGISQGQLLDEFRSTREELCRLLVELGEDKLRQHTTTGGVSFCPHTGSPYSLLYIVREFIDHDQHHRHQIESALIS